ncbi:hypothetical protein LQU92_01550 [Kocuria sp. LUK]|uniref:hypothetical protein n=1 Tax=Kocuria sp. LUK TaxID=2897828 RepID=UPI001E39427F|nr:hypothetical protein [Kocuria sp. LUK]MCD1143927.1 hypothetical protein [Kocuria sp. LUK]
MDTTHRVIAATASLLLAVVAPASAAELTPPPEPPAENEFPPASTHGKFVPLPAEFFATDTVPLCGSELTIAADDGGTGQYRALVTDEGDTVVEYRGDLTVDITRASDGATLEDVLLDGRAIETYDADGVTATFDYTGPSMVVAVDEMDVQAMEEAGLPQAFIYLSGRLSSTITLESAPVPGQQPPPAVSVEITENTAEYVFDLCDLLDQATPEAIPAP